MEFREWLYNEVDWEGDFSDVQKTCMDPVALVEYLNAVRANASVDYGKREKFGADMPFVHAKSKFFGGRDEVDVEDFAKRITEPPKTIINTNEKILKSGGPHEFVYKTGIPALRGIVYDKASGKFFVVNTCPGAGSCVLICYARRGKYIQYDEAYNSMTRRLNYLLNHPEEYEERMYAEIMAKCKEHGARVGYKPKVIIRWNDSGDFFTRKYKAIAERVLARLTKDGWNVDSYAYTKVADVANDAEFQTTFSSGANSRQTAGVDFARHKLSIVVPRDLFSDLDLMKIADESELKTRIAKKFVLPVSDIITYGEMMSIPKGESPKWHVIVTPGDGDDAAFRRDVKTILLTQH
jgi:hypothetical protein